MANTTNTGAILQILPIKDVIIKNDISVAGSLINSLNIIPYNEQSKIIPIASFANVNNDPQYKAHSQPVLEGNYPKERTIQFKGKKSYLKHFMEKIVLSNEFANNTDEENINIALGMALNRIFKGIDAQIINIGFGDYDNAIISEDVLKSKMAKLIYAANGVAQSKPGEPLNYDDVSNVYTEMNMYGTIDDSTWLINDSALFSVIDKFGNEKLSFTNVPNGAHATLLGRPVKIVSGLSDRENKEIAFALVHRNAYTATMSDVRIIKPTLDTEQALNGSKVYGVEVWVDGRCTDDASKRSRYFAPEVQQASVTEQSIDEPKPVKRKTTKIEKE